MRLEKQCGLSPHDLIASMAENGRSHWSFSQGHAQILRLSIDSWLDAVLGLRVKPQGTSTNREATRAQGLDEVETGIVMSSAMGMPYLPRRHRKQPTADVVVRASSDDLTEW